MKITTKKQYDNAFLGKDLRHAHNWKRMRLTTGKGKRKKTKVVSDETGGFLKCSICGTVSFVDTDGLNKYKQLRKQGVPTNQIKLSVKK